MVVFTLSASAAHERLYCRPRPHATMVMHACMVTKRLCKLYVCVCATHEFMRLYKPNCIFPDIANIYIYIAMSGIHIYTDSLSRFGALIAAPNRCRVHTNGPNMFCGSGYYRDFVFLSGCFCSPTSICRNEHFKMKNAKYYPYG